MTRTGRFELLSLLVAVAAFTMHGSALAQYKYVGPDGRTTYSDLPPPPGVRVIEQRKLGTATPANPPLPFELQQASTKYPVMLYTGENCAPCDEARTYLRNRGVPFTERTITSDEDIALFKQQSPEGTAPVVTVGSRRAVGFTQGTWGGLLDSAGYPAVSALPRDYQNPTPAPLSPTTRAPAQAVGPAAAPQAAQQGAARRGNPSVPGSIPSAPPAAAPTETVPGFRF